MMSHMLPAYVRRASIILVLWLALVSLTFSNSSSAVTIPERITFQNILENKDIAMGEGAAFLQDSEGFMWLGGSNALIRYDGYEFREMFLSANGAQSNIKASVKTVQHLFEDRHHSIWIATNTGMLLYNPIKEKIIKLSNDSSQSTQISTSHINHISESPTGEIIACSTSGLFIIDPVTFKYTVIAPDSNKPNWLKSKRTNKAYFDASGTFWLGTDEGLEKVDWANKIFTLFKLEPENSFSVADNRVVDIVAERTGMMWLATNHGLVHFNPKTQQITRYVNHAGDRYSLGGDDIWSLLMDSDGLLWVTSDGGGVAVFDQENNRFINYQNEPGRPGSLNTNQVRTIYEDSNGDIWVGNYPVGINFYDRSSSVISSYSRDPSNPRSLNYNTVQSVVEDDKHNLWLGTDGGGLNYFDRKTGQFSSYQHIADDPNSINGNAIIAHIQDSTGLMWVGVWAGGLASFNPADMKFTRYPFDQQRKTTESISTSNKLNSAHVRSIREDSAHNIWITTHTGGLSKLDREAKTFTHYTHQPDDPNSLADDLAWNTLEDSRGHFWVATTGGLCLMNREKGTFTTFTTDPKVPNSLSNPAVISIFEDSKKRLWLGTLAGLNLFDPDTKTFTIYDKKSGFNDDTIREILEDAEGTLWVSTNNGFSSFNPETQRIKNYSRISGRLIGGFSTNAGAVTRNGEIVLGGVNGFRIFKPSELTENKKIPPVVLTDFRVFSDSVVVDGRDGLLKKSINLTEKIELDYQKSMFVFGFATLNYRDPERNRYSYKLEGFDTRWLDAGDQRVAKYTNLDPGTYVFRVRGSNNDGVWNEIGKSITVVQLTPPWLTWWAYTLYSLAVLGLMAWFIYQQRKNRLIVERQNRILEVKVTERTEEAREKSKDIQVMLSNIPQGLFTVENDGKIHSAYSQYLESIFETKDIAGRNASDLLFTGANLSSAALGQARSAIFAIIGEDELNFTLNHNLLIQEYEVEINGKKRYLSLDWNPIVEGDIVNRLMVSVRDTTQMRQMESNLLQSEKLAALGALVAGVAHELNTPIGNGLTVATTMRDYCIHMKKQMTAGLTKATLEKFVSDVDEGTLLVNRNLERASELVSSFKQVAVDRTSAKRRKFSLREILNEIILTVSPSFKRTRYLVEIETRDDLVLDSYPGPLGQVITNLLNNAIIHAFDGRDHGRVVFATENVFGGVNISVTDDGVGISAENQLKIFDPFFTTKLGSGGNGLGMHIVHNIVTGVLGGTIHLKSQLGEGTCFTLFLPKVAPTMAPSPDDEIPR